MFENTRNDQKRNRPPYKGGIVHSSANGETLESSCDNLRFSTQMQIFSQKPSEVHDLIDTLPKQDQK